MKTPLKAEMKSVASLLTTLAILSTTVGCRDAETHSEYDDGGYPNNSLDAQTDPFSDSGGIHLLVALTSPCSGMERTGAMLFTSDAHGYIGCAVGGGLHETNDGGGSWTRIDSSANLYILDLALDKDGSLLICGHDYDTEGPNAGGLLFRRTGTQWTRLLRYGNNSTDKNAVFFSDCAAVAADNTGRLLAASVASGDMSHTADNGETWSKEDRYWENENLGGTSAAHFIYRMVSIDGAFYAGGGGIASSPYLFDSSTLASAEWWHFARHAVHPTDDGEVRSIASPDHGVTLFAGGRLNDENRGFIASSSDKGKTWTDLGLDLPGGRIHDICFAPDGQHGVACSDRQADGVVFVTADGGKTWQEKATESNKPLERCVATNDYFLVAGAKHLAKGGYQ